MINTYGDKSLVLQSGSLPHAYAIDTARRIAAGCRLRIFDFEFLQDDCAENVKAEKRRFAVRNRRIKKIAHVNGRCAGV